MLQVPVPSVQIIRAVLREYHAATHTAEVEPVLGPASLVGEIPVLMSCRPDLLTTGREVAVLTWSDVGGLVLGPYGAVPADPPSADDADKVDGIHAANTPTASKLLAMNASAKFPAHTVAGNLGVEGLLNAGSDINLATTKKKFIRTCTTQGAAQHAAFYQTLGDATDLVTIGFVSSWSGCLVKVEAANLGSGVGEMGGAIIVYSLRGHLAINPIVAATSFMGIDLTARFSWTLALGTAKLTVTPGSGGLQTATLLITVLGAARPTAHHTITWH